MRSLADQQTNDHEACNMVILVQEVVWLFETDSRFELDSDSDQPALRVDREQIQQVLLNLLEIDIIDSGRASKTRSAIR